MSRDGGGWTLLLKADGAAELAYASTWWTDEALLNEADLTVLPGNAKYPSFLALPVAELRGGLRIRPQRRTRIRLDQRRQPGRVGVIRMLMGDRDRVQSGDTLEAVREIARIEQDLHAEVLDEQAGMAEMGGFRAGVGLG